MSTSGQLWNRFDRTLSDILTAIGNEHDITGLFSLGYAAI